MKLTTRILTALLIVFSAEGVIAGVDSVGTSTLCKIVAVKEGTYKVIFQSEQKENVSVKLIDGKNQVIYAERIAGIEGFMKNYNLDNLPSGKYTLQVKSAGYALSEEFELGSRKDYKLFLSEVEDEKVLFLGFLPQEQALTLYILDENSEVLYSESIRETSEVKKSYNLKQIVGERVTFMIYHNGSLVQEKKFEL